MRVPLIDGQGNFGSVDGDPPAAMRYTEVRLAKVAHSLLEDIDKDTVDFQENYDGSEREPVVLPARFPNLLVNGAGGIAVGMATNIPPHNLGEVIDAVVALIDDPAITIDRLMEIVPGPDFPTGGIVLGRAGIASAYRTGRGSILMRGRVHTETIRKEREAIVITEIPYQVNKATMIEKMAELVRDKRIEGISDIRDESDRAGHAGGDRAPPRGDGRRRPQPALPLLAAADLVRREHGGAERRPPAADDAARHPPGLRLLPRGGDRPADQVPADEGARAGPHAGRPRHRRRPYRRGDPDHPHVEGHDAGARGTDGARLAGRGRGAADRADRRSALPPRRGQHLPALRRAGPRHPRAAPRPPHRARPRGDRRGTEEARRRDQATTSTSSARGSGSARSSRTSSRRSATSSRRRARPRSPTAVPTSRTRT